MPSFLFSKWLLSDSLKAYSFSLIAYQKFRTLSIDIPYVFYNFQCILQQILRTEFGDYNHADLPHMRAIFVYNPIPRLSSAFFGKSEIYETKIDRNVWLMHTKYEYCELFNAKTLDGRSLVLYDVTEEVNAYEIQNPEQVRRNQSCEAAETSF